MVPFLVYFKYILPQVGTFPFVAGHDLRYENFALISVVPVSTRFLELVGRVVAWIITGFRSLQ